MVMVLNLLPPMAKVYSQFIIRGTVALVVIFSLHFVTSCVRGNKLANQAPDTKISIDSINLTGAERLNSNISLSWYGSDADGYVVGYEISLNNTDWTYTTAQDSTFIFEIPAGSDTADIDFYVRSVDNDGNKDQTPAYLKVPVKNTPPVANFEEESQPWDTALCVATFLWEASDNDGNETVEKIEMRFNDGDWYEIPVGQKLVSFMLDTTASSGMSSEASVFYGTTMTARSLKINGVIPDHNNTLYLRAFDISGSQSQVDTSVTFYFKNKKNNLLWINGHPASVAPIYSNILNNINVSYDYLDFGTYNTGEQLPKYWNPTFELMLGLYEVLFVNADGTQTYKNPITSKSAVLLDFMAPAIQTFVSNGKKSLITTRFRKPDDGTDPLSNFRGAYPIDSLVIGVQGSQARINPPDSGLVPINLSTDFPKITPTNVLTEVIPIIKSDDAIDFYKGQITPRLGWQGTKLMASARRPNNQLTQVFFATELHKYDKDLTALENLFEEILKNEF